MVHLPPSVFSHAAVTITCGRCNFEQQMSGGEVPLHELLQPFVARLGGVVRGGCLVVPTRPFDVQLSIDTSSGTPMGLSLHARTAPLPEIIFTVESSLDRGTRAIGLTREVQLGDPSFDPHVWVDADLSDEVVRGVLRLPETRRAIVAVLHAGHVQPNVIPGIDVRLANGGVFTTVGLSALDDEADLRRIIEAVATLARTITPVTTPHVAKKGPRARVTFLFVLGVIVWCAALPACMAAEMHAPLFGLTGPYIWGALAGVGVWVVMLPIFGLVVRGRSSSLSTMIAASSLWLFSIAWLGAVTAPWFNWLLDDAPTEPRVATVISFQELQNDDDDSVRYVVRLRSWTDDGAELEVVRDDGGSLKPGQKLTVQVHQGYFGWPWMAPSPKVEK